MFGLRLGFRLRLRLRLWLGLELGLGLFVRVRVRVRGCGGVCAEVWVRVRVNPTWTTVAIL